MGKVTLISILAALSLMGCVSVPKGEVVRYAQFDLDTPEAALEYFKEALLRDDAVHQYLVFSEKLKDTVEKNELARGHSVRFSLQNYVLGRDEIRDILREDIGEIEYVQVGEARYDAAKPWLAEVDLTSRTKKVTVVMTLQIEYTVWFRDEPPLFGLLSPGKDPAAIRNDALLLDNLKLNMPTDPEQREAYAEAEISRIRYFHEWKILKIKGSRRFAQYLRESEKQ